MGTVYWSEGSLVRNVFFYP